MIKEKNYFEKKYLWFYDGKAYEKVKKTWMDVKKIYMYHASPHVKENILDVLNVLPDFSS